MSILGGYPFRLMEASLDAAMLRQKVIANNIANVDTPNFKRSEVRFEELLQQQSRTSVSPVIGLRTDPRHFYIGPEFKGMQPDVVTDHHSVIHNDLNNVDIDLEMANMAKNQLRYSVIVQQVNHEIKNVRTAIEGR